MNKEIEKLIEESLELRKNNLKEDALIALSKAFDLLVDESAIYAKKQEGAQTENDLRLVEAKLISHSNDFLKKNLSSAMILNNMGILFSELEQYDAALQKFEESIHLIPEGQEYGEPFENRDSTILKLQEMYKDEQGLSDDFLD